jgi:hypothetical protein
MSLLLSDFGAPRPTGCLTNLFSSVAEVGRSSKISSSVPSPKLRRLVGFVIVLFAADGRSLLLLPGVSGRRLDSRDIDLRGIGPSFEPSESWRRKCREDLILI